MMKWCDMNKALRATYLDHRDEQREIEEATQIAEAVARESLRKGVVAALAVNGLLSVRTLDLEYNESQYFLWNGVKGGGNRGYGWSERIIPSQFVVVVEAMGGRLELRVGAEFREAIGSLTKKRRDLIRRAMPPNIELVPGRDPRNGDSLILVSPQALSRWIEDAQILIAADPSRESA